MSLVPGLKVKNISVNHSADIAKHPTEMSMEVVDHKVITPKTVQVEGFCEDRGAYNRMVECFTDRVDLFGVQVKELLIENLVFGEFTPVRESKVLSAIPVSFTMHEIMEVVGTTGLESAAVQNPRDADTIKRGNVQGTAMPPADQATNMIASGI